MQRSLLAVAVLAALSQSACLAWRSDLDARTKELEETQALLGNTKKDLASTKSTLAKTKQALADANDAIAQGKARETAQRQQATALSASLAKMQAEALALSQEKGKLSKESRAKQAELAAQLEGLRKQNEELNKSKQELELIKREYDRVMDKLKAEIDAGKIEVSIVNGRMVVKMKDKILFSSGRTDINEEGRIALAKLSEVLRDLKGKRFQVEGHTDNVPTRGKFPTNWELSCARAVEITKFMQVEGIDPTLLSAAGYGEYQPIASNDDEAGRSKNRRIEIVLIPDQRAAQLVAKPSK